MKKLMIACAGLCIASAFMATTLYIAWTTFQPVAIVASSIQSDETDLEKISEAWFDDFFKQYEGIFTPFDYRITDKKINTIEVLDQVNGFVQIDYQVKPASVNVLSQTYYAAQEQDGVYKIQVVLQFVKSGDTFIVNDKMTPAAYQIGADPSIREPQTQHYAMADEDETYFFDKKKLYVTYNHGESSVEVPIDYEDIAGTNNSLYNELLPAYGYIVSKAFTAFIAYDEYGCYMRYSEDEGSTWKTSRIYNNRYRSETVYLSKTNSGCYVNIATDRSLGSEYYTTFKTSDYETWTPLSGDALADKDMVIFFDNQIGYSSAGTTQDKQAKFYYIEQDGAKYQVITLPKQEVSFLDMMITPFVQMEYVYLEDGKTYMVVGQGSNGDYMKDKHFMNALYVSNDGINFVFEKEIAADSLTLAG